MYNHSKSRDFLWFELILWLFPDMNYFVRAMWVILIAFSFVAAGSWSGGWRAPRDLWVAESKVIRQLGWGLLASLVLLHIVFH